MQICRYMNGSKCAESYCDMWDTVEKICTDAVIANKKIEVLNIILEEFEKINKKHQKNKDVVKVYGLCKQVLH